MDGSLDTTFGTNGTVTTDFNGGDNYPASLALQTNGKIVLVGPSYQYIGGYYTTQEMMLARYNTNGSLDTTFGTAGEVIEPNSSSPLYSGLVIQTDGKIVVGANQANGYVGYGTLMLRYNSNGTADHSFLFTSYYYYGYYYLPTPLYDVDYPPSCCWPRVGIS
ncbi:MAG: hypothetical protein QM796_11405 [Chthoniobacteraceae bacterium]